MAIGWLSIQCNVLYDGQKSHEATAQFLGVVGTPLTLHSTISSPQS